MCSLFELLISVSDFLSLIYFRTLILSEKKVKSDFVESLNRKSNMFKEVRKVRLSSFLSSHHPGILLSLSTVWLSKNNNSILAAFFQLLLNLKAKFIRNKVKFSKHSFKTYLSCQGGRERER